ncbi:hypothetical protein CC80DRAFT_253920 [Byssothecium circinans]|uniref:EthD domain-containing protein n=1 Tax=Byssothecium circinans TaxID=147558 RepID=A0A6A5TD75_9PLEO|nr:hypothetical protein CC80DRAFT_253920 [Byssothecium circinans]
MSPHTDTYTRADLPFATFFSSPHLLSTNNMPFVIFLYLYRKPGLTFQEFRDGMENVAFPWLFEYYKPHQPLAWTRHYVCRRGSKTGQRLLAYSAPPADPDPDAPVVMLGGITEFPWDVMIRVVYRDELHFNQYFAWLNEPENAANIAASEEEFSDPTKLKAVVIGEVVD